MGLVIREAIYRSGAIGGKNQFCMLYPESLSGLLMIALFPTRNVDFYA